MSRPEGTSAKAVPCYVRLAGESPATVSAGAPCSRLRVRGEIPSPERSVESPRGAVRPHAEGSNTAGPMRQREPCSPVR
jgi:hypothetical protein